MKKVVILFISFFMNVYVYAQLEITEKGYFYSPNGFVCKDGNIYTADMTTIVRFGYLGKDENDWVKTYPYNRNVLIIPDDAEMIPSNVLYHPTPYHYMGGSADCPYVVMIPSSVKYIALDAFICPFVRFYNSDNNSTAQEQVGDHVDVTEVARYNLQGKKINIPERGINIVQMSNETARKELVK